MQQVSPSIKLASFTCPHCGTFAAQPWHNVFVHALMQNELPELLLPEHLDRLANKLRAAYGDVEHVAQQTARLRELAAGAIRVEVQEQKWANKQALNLSISICYACNEVAIWKHTALIYPSGLPGERPSDDMPADVRADFEEARSILNASPRGAAALLRLALQKLCVHLGESGKDINKDIGQMVAKGLPVSIQKALDIVRVVGNESVHPGELDMRDDRETVAALLRLINLIIENRITQPRQIDALYNSLPSTKTAGIAARDAAALNSAS